MPDTTFVPATDGFLFRNRFSNHRFAFGGIHLVFGGRCAGMIYAALDYFHARRPRPADTELPAEGTALSTYISIRQDAATWGTVDRWMELVLGQPVRSAEFYRWGMQEGGGGQAGQLKAAIDADNPVPIGLVAANDLVAHHHQVLAIGYDGAGDGLRVRVYDPNLEGVVRTLRPFPDLQRWGFEGTGTDEGPDNALWRTYFVDPSYVHRAPFVHIAAHLPDLSGTHHQGRTYHRQSFAGAHAEGADFTGATATYVDFSVANLQYAKFQGANVSHSSFRAAYLRRANFTGADLKVATLAEVRAPGANFHGADLKLVNEKVPDAAMGSMELEGANFYGADLHRAKLFQAIARGANFQGANLSHADLRSVDFTGANLTGADLRHAKLDNAILTDARLDGADLRAAVTVGAVGLPTTI